MLEFRWFPMQYIVLKDDHNEEGNGILDSIESRNEDWDGEVEIIDHLNQRNEAYEP